MKKIIRLTESELHSIINNAVMTILKEDGIGGTSDASINGDGSGDASFGVAYPAFGGEKKSNSGKPFGEPIMRQKHNLGDVTQAKTNQVDMGETQKRSKDFDNGSMAIQRVGEKKK